MGAAQFDWTCSNLRQSNARWKVLGNQVMMAPLKAFGQVLNQDQWDGYPAERQKLWDTIMNHNITNDIVCSECQNASISFDGRLIAYQSRTNGTNFSDVFVKETFSRSVQCAASQP